jgi:hypothetical protein
VNQSIHNHKYHIARTAIVARMNSIQNIVTPPYKLLALVTPGSKINVLMMTATKAINEMQDATINDVSAF